MKMITGIVIVSILNYHIKVYEPRVSYSLGHTNQPVSIITKLGSLGLIPRIHIVERKNPLPQIVF